MIQGKHRSSSERHGPFELMLPCVTLILLLFALACSKEDSNKIEQKQESPVPVPALSQEFIRRGAAELHEYLGPETYLYELRATGNVFSIQVALAEKKVALEDASLATGLVQVDYVETPGPAGQAPKGKITPPSPVEIRGNGALKDNIFPYKDIHLFRMARGFKVALNAVDPEAGSIERLVVRRFLPFSEGIRGRIFVKSPRMNGSIDVNEKGYPLKP